MRKVDLQHFGLYGMHHHTGVNGLFDFIRSDKAIANRETRKDSRLDYRETSGQARRDNRFDRGQTRREKRLIKSENRMFNSQNGTSTVRNIANGLVNLFTKKEPSYPVDPTPYAQIDTTPKTNKAGGIVMALVATGLVFGGGVLLSKKDRKPKKK